MTTMTKPNHLSSHVTNPSWLETQKVTNEGELRLLLPFGSLVCIPDDGTGIVIYYNPDDQIYNVLCCREYTLDISQLMLTPDQLQPLHWSLLEEGFPRYRANQLNLLLQYLAKLMGD